MNNVSLIITIFLLICFYHYSSAQECECDIFQTSKNLSEKNLTLQSNLTKQSGEINRRHFYFSKTDEEEKILWWNDTASSWMIQAFTSFSGGVKISIKEDPDCPKLPQYTEEWKIISNGSNDGEIRSRCLEDKNKGQVNGEFDVKPVMFLQVATYFDNY